MLDTKREQKEQLKRRYIQRYNSAKVQLGECNKGLFKYTSIQRTKMRSRLQLISCHHTFLIVLIIVFIHGTGFKNKLSGYAAVACFMLNWSAEERTTDIHTIAVQLTSVGLTQ